MKKIKNKIFLFNLILLLFLGACSANSTEKDLSTEKMQVVTSIFPVYEITKEIAGDRAEVTLLVGENEDAHHYEPNAQAVNAVNNADVFIYSSKVMEFWIDRLLNVVENEDVHIIELMDFTEYEGDHTHEDHNHHDGVDPHFWLDLILVKEKLPHIVEKLSLADPEGAGIYKKNANKFTASLDQLNQDFIQAFADAENRVFIVQHQSFGYLAKRYNLEQVSVGGLITEVEPDPKALINIVNFIREHKVPIVYYQSGEKSSIAKTIAKETDTEIEILYDLENKPHGLDKGGNIYLEAMKYNLEQLKKSIY